MSLIPKNGKVAVVGAGISGLTYSYFLSKLRPDVSISILESLARPGGWISTEKLNDAGKEIILEKGPRTLRGVSDGTLLIVDILRHLQLENQVEVMKSTSIANRKWLLDSSNNLVQVPNSVSSLLKFLGSDVTDGLVRGVLREPFQSKSTDAQDESIQSFFQRRFGSPEIADNILSAVMHGIYSGNVAKLSVQTTLPSLVEMEKKDGSIVKSMLRKMRSQKNKVSPTINETLAQYESLISPDSNLGQLSQSLKKFPILRLQDGLQVLPNALAESLSRQNNITINYESEVDSLDLKSGALSVNGKKDNYDHVRFTSGAARLSEVVGRDPELQQVLNSFEYSSIFMANVYSKKGGLIPAKGNGFGFLVPSRNSNPESLLGVIFDSDTESDAEKFFGGSQVAKVSYDKVTLMMGGHYFNERGIPSTSINLRAARNVLSSILGVKLDNYNIILRDEATENSKEVKLEDNDLLISYNLHKNCIPQYNVGFLDKVKSMVSIVDEKSKRKVSIGGTSLGKLGVPDCVMNSLEDALAQGR